MLPFDLIIPYLYHDRRMFDFESDLINLIYYAIKRYTKPQKDLKLTVLQQFLIKPTTRKGIAPFWV